MPAERPIIFSAPMVRAILAGTKTQTRRVVISRDGRLQPGNAWAECLCAEIDPADVPCVVCEARFGQCRYGVVGDRLWVRETFYCDDAFVGDYEHQPYINKTLTRAEQEAEWAEMLYYAADGPIAQQDEWSETPKLKPSIFMPRWASRLTLEVTGVRIERLHEITEEGSRAEGVRASDAAIIFQNHAR